MIPLQFQCGQNPQGWHVWEHDEIVHPYNTFTQVAHVESLVYCFVCRFCKDKKKRLMVNIASQADLDKLNARIVQWNDGIFV